MTRMKEAFVFFLGITSVQSALMSPVVEFKKETAVPIRLVKQSLLRSSIEEGNMKSNSWKRLASLERGADFEEKNQNCPKKSGQDHFTKFKKTPRGFGYRCCDMNVDTLKTPDPKNLIEIRHHDNTEANLVFGVLVVLYLAALYFWKPKNHETKKLAWKKQSKSRERNRRRLLATCVLLLMTPTADALEIKGPYVVNSPVTWTAADSPINIAGVVDIQGGGTLVIQPGTHVIFQDSSSGIINSGGTLLITGDFNNRVVLKPANPSFNWQGIEFRSAAHAAVFSEAKGRDLDYASGSVMQYVDIVRAGSGSKYALDFTQGKTPFIQAVNLIECDSSNTGRHVIRVEKLTGFFVAKYLKIMKESVESTFVSNRGIYVTGENQNNGIFLMDNVDIMSTGYDAVDVRGLFRLTVQDCHIRGQVYLYSISEVGFNRNTVEIPNNGQSTAIDTYHIGSSEVNHEPLSFTDNVVIARPLSFSMAFHAYWDGPTTSARSVIGGNTFYYGQLHLDFQWQCKNISVSDNKVIESLSGGIWVQGSGCQAGDLVVYNNTIEDSSSTNYAMLHLSAYYGNFFEARGNTVSKCTADTVLIYLQGNGNYLTGSTLFEENAVVNSVAVDELLQLDNYPFSSVQQNLFINATAPVSVNLQTLASSFMTSDTVSLPANYWGVFQDDLQGVRATVKDGLTTSNGAVLELKTILLDPLVNSSLTYVQLPGPILPDGSVGGVVRNGSFVLSSSEYNCSLSLIVFDNATLELSPDTSIYFAPSRGIVVHETGSLVASGTEDYPIFLRPLYNTWWRGVLLTSAIPMNYSHINIDGAVIGIEHAGSGALVLDSIRINGTQRDCILSRGLNSWNIEGNDLAVYSSNFEACGNQAIQIDRRSVVMLSTIGVSGSNGVYTGYNVKDVSVINSRFEGTTDYGIRLNGWYQSIFYEISNNSFVGTNGGLNLYCTNSCSASVNGNVFNGDNVIRTYAYALNLECESCRQIYVQDNQLHNWDIRYSAAMRFVYNGQSPFGLEASGNVFSNISAPNVMDVSYRNDYNASNIQGVFADNLEATSTADPALVVVRQWPSQNTTFSGNIFTTVLRNDTAQYFVKVLELASETPKIDASMSYWGSADPLEVIAGIFDGLDETQYSELIFNPYLLTPNASGEAVNATIPFLRNGNVLSGRLEHDVNLTLSEGNYTSQGSLLIDGNLFLEPGVLIWMDQGSSLLVDNGLLMAKGLPEKPVFFKASETRWGRIEVASTAGSVFLEHVNLSGTGSPILVKRSALFRNITMLDCSGGGLHLFLAADETFSLDGFDFRNMSNGYSQAIIQAQGSGNVTLKNGFMSSEGSSFVFSRDAVNLVVTNVEMRPKSQSMQGLELQNRGTSLVEAVVFDATSLSGIYYGYSFYAGYNVGPVTMRGCRFEVPNSYSYVFYVSGNYYSSGLLKLQDNLIIFNGSANYLIYVGQAGSVEMIGNRIVGKVGATTNYALYVYSRSVVLHNNTFDSFSCQRDCLSLEVSTLNVTGNLISSVNVKSPYGLLSIDSETPQASFNRFDNCSGYSAFFLRGSRVTSLVFTENILTDGAALKFFVSTSTQFKDIDGGIYTIGSNFWDTTSFEELRAKTFDSLSQASLASIFYSGIYVDESLSVAIDPPPAGSIVDTVRRTISGTVFEAVTIRVKAGLYYAPRSIILQHPGAVLIFEAGVRILFDPSVTIRITAGEFRILGNTTHPVLLSSIDRLVDEYGDPEIPSSSEWGGIWFGPDAEGSDIVGSQYADGSVIKHCILVNGGYGSMPAAVYLDRVGVMIDNGSIERSGSDGVYAYHAPGDFLIRDSVIEGSKRRGVYVDSAVNAQSVVIQDTNITMSVNEGLYVYYCESVKILGSHFVANYGGQTTGSQIYSYGGMNFFNISDSSISNSNNYGLRIDWGSNLGVNIAEVNFIGLRLALYVASSSSEKDIISVSLCQFLSNSCPNCDVVDLRSYRSIVFEGNLVESNEGNNIVHLDMWRNYQPYAKIHGNIFRKNQAKLSTSGETAVLSLASDGTSTWNIQGNDFDDYPSSRLEITTFDFSGAFPADMVVNATNNRFALPANLSEAVIDNRIHDDDEDPSLTQVAIVPFLPSNYTPVCDLDCSNQGTCVFPGYCICEEGWGGPACGTPTCQRLGFCSRRGQCVDFDVCDCDDNWLGESCSVANCTVCNSCNGNGFCALPNVCTCSVGYTGECCDECVPNYKQIGKKCVECPVCYNGGSCSVCGNKACCECPQNFAGDQCRQCSPGYFGAACLPLPYIESVAPNDAIDEGGIAIRIDGINFGDVNSTKKCYIYGAGTVEAILDGASLRCISPSVQVSSSGLLYSYLQLIVDGIYSYNTIPFTFYGSCPEEQCQNGFCSFGRCQCYYGFRGEACDEQLVAPAITDIIDPFTLVEGKPFNVILSLDKGSGPVEWAILGVPPLGMVMNSSTGKLSWQSPEATLRTQSVRVQARNELASDYINVYFEVSPSYYVKVSTDAVSMMRPAPRLIFNVETRAIDSNALVGGKLATLWIREAPQGSGRKIDLKTSPYGTFSIFYQPYSFEAGTFVYGGEHPGYENSTVQGEFFIMGVDISPSSYLVSGFTGETVLAENAFRFSFRGGSFSGISVAFDEAESLSLTSSLGVNSTNSSSSSVDLSFEVTADEALQGRLYFTLQTNEGITKSAFIYLDIRDRRPRLRVSPSRIDIQAAKGGAVVYRDVTLENIGSYRSSPIRIVMPDQAILRSISDETIPSLDVDENTTVQFAFAASEDMDVGTTFSGVIGLQDNLTSAELFYRVTVVSEVPAVLTVVTQDEATYFAEDTPNLANVSVRIKSLTVGTSYTESSGPNGTLTFPDLVEDFYEIYAQKLGHVSFRKEIFLEAPGQLVEAFLQADPVSYTFSVVEVEVLDKYVIQVEATFETFVPRPVIVWDPVILDWEGIRSGLVDEIQVTATNYGLITAHNLTYRWLPYFENARFILPNEEEDPTRVRNIGTVPANSSVVFPVTIEQIVRFDIPEGFGELRHGNNILFVPEDETRQQIIVAEESDPVMGQSLVLIDDLGRIESVFEFSTSILYTFLYAGTNSTDVLDVIETANASLPERRLFVEDVLPLKRIEESRNLNAARDCTQAIACETCKRVIKNPIKACDLIKYYSCESLAGAGKAACTVITDVCTYIDPCNLICKPEIDIGGCAEYECSGTIKLCISFPTPNLGDCELDLDFGGPGPTSSVGPSRGGESRGCGRCGFGDVGGWDIASECGPSSGSRRRLGSSNVDLPTFMVPSHRALLSGCPKCSDGDLKVLFQALDNAETKLLATETALQTCVNSALGSGGIKSFFPCALRRGLESLRFMLLASEVIACQLDQEPCYTSDDLARSPGLQNLLIQADRLATFVDLALLPFGGTLSDEPVALVNGTPANSTQINDFSTILVNAIADDSEGGKAISSRELELLQSIGFGVPGSLDLSLFADTWNESSALWENKIFSKEDLPQNYSSGFFDLTEASNLMQKFSQARSKIQQESFSGFSDAWLTAVEAQQFEEAKQLAGVCATVRVRIEQELTLTRIGFEARLEIANGGAFPLVNVSVTLRATLFRNATAESTDLFVIGQPELDGINAVDGTGRIEPSSNAKATWLMLPLTEAAPMFDTKYDISGILLYSIDGVEYIQNLAPDTITVRPDPQLFLTYFHSRAVYADDPFTTAVEPAIPYHLGLLIENRGYGDARKVEIVSAQPEIIENEKGLLVDFTIIGSRMGNKTMSNSLKIDFGTIPAQSNVVGIWDLVSTLRGNFFNFSASFQYQGPIDDARLSLIENVSVYELTHLVRVVGNHPAMLGGLGYTDDGIDDFLVNKNPDAFYYPDTVFTSDTRERTYPVSSVVGRGWWDEPQYAGDSGDVITVLVYHNLTGEEQGLLQDWVYIRLDDPMMGTDYLLLSVTRTDVDYVLISQSNAWQTSWTEYLLGGVVEEQNYVHLFDFGVAPTYLLTYVMQLPVTNLRITASTNSSLSVAWNDAPGANAHRSRLLEGDDATGTRNSYVIIKPFGATDRYYKVAKRYLQINSCTIGQLAAGTRYTIKVFTGHLGNYEKVGAEVIGNTIGASSECGDSYVDVGEECDEGPANGLPESNCTDFCMHRRSSNVDDDDNDDTQPPSEQPTDAPSEDPIPAPTPPPTKKPPGIDDNGVCAKKFACRTRRGRITRYFLHKQTTFDFCRTRCTLSFFAQLRLKRGWSCGQCSEGKYSANNLGPNDPPDKFRGAPNVFDRKSGDKKSSNIFEHPKP